ncbi:MAG: hypothetical protein PHO53_01855 [Actinomycetota bacterium]|nr:hypothetical protein [Actinomycetota bacterium]
MYGRISVFDYKFWFEWNMDGDKTHKLKRCRECGSPRKVSQLLNWNDNGTITQSLNRNFRVVILHSDFLDGLFESVEKRLGVSIGHIAFEAQRNASKTVFGAVKQKLGPLADILTRSTKFKRAAVEQFNDTARITGQCLSETIEYIPGERGVARIRNPFNLDLMAANVVGAFELLESKPFEHEVEKVGDDTYILKVASASEKPEISERMELRPSKLFPGGKPQERCPRCHVPTDLSCFSWFEEQGIIVDERRGIRVVFLDGYVPSAVFREIATELGEDFYDLVVEAERDWTTRNAGKILGAGSELSGDRVKKAFERYLEMLRLYGQGNPAFLEVDADALSVIIENPYEVHLLAGMFSGLYEAIVGERARVTWDLPREQVARYRVKPA